MAEGRIIECALALLAIAGCASGAVSGPQAFDRCVARMQVAARAAAADPELARGRLNVFAEDVTFEQPALEPPRLYAGFLRYPPPHERAPWPPGGDWISIYQIGGERRVLPLDGAHLYYLDGAERLVELRRASAPPRAAQFQAGRRPRRGVGFLQAQQLSPAALDRYVALFRPAIDECLRLAAATAK